VAPASSPGPAITPILVNGAVVVASAFQPSGKYRVTATGTPGNDASHYSVLVEVTEADLGGTAYGRQRDQGDDHPRRRRQAAVSVTTLCGLMTRVDALRIRGGQEAPG
jgi:hypothetical protein